MKIKSNLMLRILIFATLLTGLIPGTLASDHLIIAEVLYDPQNTETGGEAVLIFNPTSNSVNLSGFTIKTESSNADVTLPNEILKSQTYFLIADVGWDSSRDNISWPVADHEEAITMSNSDAGVALVYNNSIIDAVGWGEKTGILEGLYEVDPALDVTPGKSLRRKTLQDTNNNYADFYATVPIFKSLNSSQNSTQNKRNSTNYLTLTVNVSNFAPVLSEIISEIDDNPKKQGIQILPEPGKSRAVSFSFNISDENSLQDISNLSAVIRTKDDEELNVSLEHITNFSSTKSSYVCSFNLNFHQPSGNYSLLILAKDKAVNVTKNKIFEVMELISINIDAESLFFPEPLLGGYSQILGDMEFSTKNKPTIANTGNIKINLGAYGADLIDGNKSIPVNNIMFSFDNTFNETLSAKLSKTPKVISTNLFAGTASFITLGLQLYVPTTTENGAYSSTINIIAAEV